MKNFKFSYLLILLLLGSIVFVACSKEQPTETNQEAKENPEDILMARGTGTTLDIEFKEGLYKIIYRSSFMDSTLTSDFIVYHNNVEQFRIDYTYKTDELHWKLKQAPKVIDKAEYLKNRGVPVTVLKATSLMLTESIGYIYSKTIDKKDINLIATLNYYKSVLNTTVRAHEGNEACNCTVHPEFLMEQSFFNCQEEHFYKVSQLRSILAQYVAENPNPDSRTQSLMNHLSNSSEEYIRFDAYYDFYVDNADFDVFVDQTLASASGDCAWWCPLGCGSGHGCCGNYSGCCLYWHPGCYVHDRMCTNCKPEWFCLPGCKPDAQKKASLQLTMH